MREAAEEHVLRDPAVGANLAGRLLRWNLCLGHVGIKRLFPGRLRRQEFLLTLMDLVNLVKTHWMAHAFCLRFVFKLNIGATAVGCTSASGPQLHMDAAVNRLCRLYRICFPVQYTEPCESVRCELRP